MTPAALLPLLPLAQDAPAAGDDWLYYMVQFLAFVGVSIFTFVGYVLFSAGWESYEERYLEGAERTLDDLFLTIPPQQLLWLTILSGAAFFVLPFALSGSVIPSLMFGALGAGFPRATLWLHKRQRGIKFQEQLVGALNTITNALRSGFSMPKAFQLIASDMPKPICQEFGILVQELRLGIEVQEGLENMLARLPSQDLDLVVTSVSISAQVGGNLAEVFDRLCEAIRERRRIEGRIDALTAQGKIQGVLVSALPVFVAMALMWIDPELMMPLFTTLIGKLVLLVMCVMEIVGCYLILKITSIEV